ncbi:hypothetical protein PR202_gb14319 [Eleusine coracana subsp. coracana]|uniref:Uncharacterized protein n=1 Tax=Eleusine coracana subsp. coracana TaxID=191504 RepID=A0AAV5EVF3_ELECO|nr:hypothetical protein PR202_gb14319 [Eleusine coracana subsp. coracana]
MRHVAVPNGPPRLRPSISARMQQPANPLATRNLNPAGDKRHQRCGGALSAATHHLSWVALHLRFAPLQFPSDLFSFTMDTNSTSAGSGSHGQGRSSRCVTEVITATHHFEVPDFSLLDGIGIGKSVSSSTFRVGGCDWNFRLYPDGFKPTTEGETAASVSVLLCLRKGAAVVNAEFDFILLDKHGKASELAASGSPLKHTFESVGESWGMGTFVEKSAELQTFLRLNDDTLRIMCVLTVTKESPSRAVTPTIAVPPANLQQDLAYMLKDGRCKDVTFSVDGQLFDAHRCVLAARSPVFEVELFGQPKKKPEHYCIQIDDMEPAVFEALLHFIYTDTLPAGSDDATGDDNNLMRMQHLLVAAIRYGLERLQLMCEAKLCDAIDVLTVGMILGLAEQHHCVRLKDACLRYIASGDVLSSVMVTDEFKHLTASCPSIVTDILDKVAVVGNNTM